MTTMAAAKATASGINTSKERGNSEVKSIQELHAAINDKQSDVCKTTCHLVVGRFGI